ncbi:MAG: tRNA (N6-threonylcarbamoyladenosine(37)-N6)-methyltransferase TrmO [Deltaproteobacteria bacterium]|nr:tRNA (N6-threonylcarbamoyladenosine(37)-N6)-methyltransferase TrmO [Deltaproteobacteria bacterium]MBW1986522.1 tRNA (N6-threonylcarbamoyladenosine(37)-N6)-methyltransferase TrmO [Deltaproteobacteria bacterium]MBW2135101.1 tRNA (N6-threonylcarbamoyladenosine(37)-N6)-methyltransferase TrmO [Deltaproteobacteria bacterium]
MKINFKPIGYVRTASQTIPRHWTVSEVTGTLEIDPQYQQGLKDIKPGQRILVIFHFHKSPMFTPQFLTQSPPHRQERLGVFSICSSIRPNPIGLSRVEVLGIEGHVIQVKGLDMLDGTPILDIKPHIEDKHSLPSFPGERRPSTP